MVVVVVVEAEEVGLRGHDTEAPVIQPLQIGEKQVIRVLLAVMISRFASIGPRKEH